MIDAGGANIRVAIEGEGPLVLMVHGFPESWFSWRHQLGPIADAGFTAAAMDVRGYGGSDKPRDVGAYDMESLVADVAGVAHALQPNDPAILVGHDWGAPIVWNTALSRPGQVAAAAGLSIPYMGVPRRPFSDVIREAFTDKGQFFYQAWLQDVGPPEREAEADVRGFLRRFLFATCGEAPDGAWPEKRHGASLLEGLVDPQPFPSWLSDADLDYYVGEFMVSGFFGPMSRYRNYQRDFDWLQTFRGRTLDMPTLLIGGARDPAFYGFGRIPDPAALMTRHVTDLRRVEVLSGCGHWVQQERPQAVNAILISWLKGL